MAGGGSVNKQQQGLKATLEHVTGMTYSKLSMVITVACVCSCLYALSLVFISTKPCLNSLKRCEKIVCDATDSTTLDVPAERAAQYDHIVSLTNPKESSMNSEGKLSIKHPERNSETPLMALDGAVSKLAFSKPKNTSLANIVFGVAASSKLWKTRKYYIKQWWQSKKMRGFVWLEELSKNETWDSDVPPFKISGNTSRFKYTNKNGNRSAIRLSRIVSEMFRLALPNVDWFVMGDDDTVFFTENLVRMLSKYDCTKMYYIGSQSESHLQNTAFSYNMAYGGGGFAISYPLAKALSEMQDDCLHRYPHLFGSDDRMHACITELGVPIIKNPGFHQFDIYGSALGLMAAHPLTPVLSIHHLDIIDAIFPNRTKISAVMHLMKAAKIEQASMLQQTIVYGRRRRYSFSISSGYVIQVYRGFMAPWELEEVSRTFLSWYFNRSPTHFPFNIREIPKDKCKQATLFYMKSVYPKRTSEGLIETVYVKEHPKKQNLTGCDEGLNPVERIRVRREPLDKSWFETRRLCGRVATWRNDTIDIYVKPCQEDELVIGSS